MMHLLCIHCIDSFLLLPEIKQGAASLLQWEKRSMAETDAITPRPLLPPPLIQRWTQTQEPPLLQPWTHTEDHGPTADATAAHIDLARGCAAVPDSLLVLPFSNSGAVDS